MAEHLMTCPSCSAVTAVPTCASCGADLLQAAGEHVRTASERDQTASDSDQTSSDRDQTASDSDQRSSDEDQHAADENYAAGGDARAHERGTAAREHATRDRGDTSELRDASAGERVEAADDRDRSAAARDALAELHDLQADEDASPDDVMLRAQRDRARAASDRARAAEDRARAAADREEAARERAEALRNRTESADLLRRATTDELTGAWTRKFGLEEVLRELERAQRTRASLTLAFVDVDGLKEVNDSLGHPAGDELLRRVGETIRAHVRTYDVIVRYGGDEFVCALPNLQVPEARVRFAQIADELRKVDPEHAVTVGLAEAQRSDTLSDLIARADADLLEARRRGS